MGKFLYKANNFKAYLSSASPMPEISTGMGVPDELRAK
jgi:hypothetical protein